MTSETGKLEALAVAASKDMGMTVFWRKRGEWYEVYRKIPGGRVSLVKRTKSATSLVKVFAQEMKARNNPAPRSADTEGARRLAARFHGRQPDADEYATIAKPVFPDAMANIGKIFAIEYLAERDGKVYRFRHEFKSKSRPHLAVSPDGNLVTMIGGSWEFTEDGFEDH